jgi:hypothetical protein
MTDARLLGAAEAAFIAAVRSDDTARFALITERHRRELQVRCYRMLATPAARRSSPASSGRGRYGEVRPWHRAGDGYTHTEDTHVEYDDQAQPPGWSGHTGWPPAGPVRAPLGRPDPSG